MTLTDALGKTRIRRILLPGFILTVGVHPFAVPLTGSQVGGLYGLSSSLLFVIEIGILGLLLSSLSTPVFYIYEGFHWPWLTAWLRALNEKRLAGLERVLRELDREIEALETKRDAGASLTLEEQKRLRKLTDARDLKEQCRDEYPLNESSEHVVERPTRLTNVVASYELYPEIRYGVDGTFFWNHLLAMTEESARTHFNETADTAESLLLASAAAVMVALTGSVFLLASGVGTLAESLRLFESPAPPSLGWIQLTVGLTVSVIFYRLAIPAYREVAKSFLAVVDLAMPRFLKWLEKAPTTPPRRTIREREENVRMYLRSMDSQAFTSDD